MLKSTPATVTKNSPTCLKNGNSNTFVKNSAPVKTSAACINNSTSNVSTKNLVVKNSTTCNKQQTALSIKNTTIIENPACKTTIKAQFNIPVAPKCQSAKVPITSFLRNMAANNQTTNTNSNGTSNTNSNNTNNTNSITSTSNGTQTATTNGNSSVKPENAELRIIIIDENWSQYCYRIKINTPFGKLINRFCQQVRKIDHKSVLFWYHGRLVEDEDTPKTLNIKDGEVILAHYIK